MVIPPVLQDALQSPVPPVPVPEKVDLRSRVSSMAQAMGSFGDIADEPSDAVLQAPGASGTTTGSTAATLAVVSMVDAMKQFDVNGKMAGVQASATTSLGKSLTVPGIQDPANSGFLTSGSK